MEFHPNDVPTTGQWFSKHQFMAFLEGQKCCYCDNRAKWLPHDKGNGYCDDHFPYYEEKLNEEKLD